MNSVGSQRCPRVILPGVTVFVESENDEVLAARSSHDELKVYAYEDGIDPLKEIFHMTDREKQALQAATSIIGSISSVWGGVNTVMSVVTGGTLPSNPAGAVRGPKYVVKHGKTPVLVGRPGPAAVGLDRRGRAQRTSRSCPNRRHGLQLRPRERCCDVTGRGLLRARQARMAAAA